MYFSKLTFPFLTRLIKHVKTSPCTILDFGFAEGRLTMALLQEGYLVAIHETSCKHINSLLLQEIKEHKNFLGVASQTSFKEQFDIICCFDVSAHILPHRFEQELKNIYQFLKPKTSESKGGILVGSVPYNKDSNSDVCLCPQCKTLFHRLYHASFFDETTLLESLKQVMEFDFYAVVALSNSMLFAINLQDLHSVRNLYANWSCEIDYYNTSKLNKEHYEKTCQKYIKLTERNIFTTILYRLICFINYICDLFNSKPKEIPLRDYWPKKFEYNYATDFIRIAKLENFEITKEAKILDFGCGAANAIRQFCEKGFDIYGYDVRDFVDEINESYRDRISFFEEGLLYAGNYNIDWSRFKLPYNDNEFDCIITCQVLEHVEDHEIILSELARVLKPTGFTLHTFPAKYAFIETHTNVPFGNLIVNKLYFFIWALLGIKTKNQSNKSIREIATFNYSYMQNGVNYLSNKKMTSTALKYFKSAKISTKYSFLKQSRFRFIDNIKLIFAKNLLLVTSGKK